MKKCIYFLTEAALFLDEARIHLTQSTTQWLTVQQIPSIDIQTFKAKDLDAHGPSPGHFPIFTSVVHEGSRGTP